MKTKTKTEDILTVMHILAWVAFIGLLIEGGAMVVSYVVSWLNPEAARDVYKGQGLSSLRQFSFLHYTFSISFLVALSGTKAYMSFLVIKTLSKVNLVNPFTTVVARLVEEISYVMLGTAIIAILYNAYGSWLSKQTETFQGETISGEFIFVAGLVFIISQVFKRGVEIQSENDLTV